MDIKKVLKILEILEKSFFNIKLKYYIIFIIFLFLPILLYFYKKKNKKISLEELRKKNYEKRKSEIKKIAKKVTSEFNSLLSKSKNVEEQTTETLENMITMGDIMKDAIIIEKKENPEKFVNINEAIKNEKDDNFAISLLAKNLENNGITTAVEKEADEENKDVAATNLQFMINGLSSKQKLDVHFDYGKKKNEQILNDPVEQKKFLDDWKRNLSEKLGVPVNDIIITNIKEGSIDVNFMIKTHDNFDKLTQAIKEVANTKGVNIKNMNAQPLTGGIKLSPNMFDKRGNRSSGWGVGEKRGGKPYFPPTKGYVGHGLKVWGEYDGGNNDWLGMENKPNEWWVAYHATNLQYTKSIMENGLQAGNAQVHENAFDLNHPGKKVGRGVYCSPDINETEGYGGECQSYKCVFMCRVNPKTVRISQKYPKYWVVDGNPNDIRPYRLLIKKV